MLAFFGCGGGSSESGEHGEGSDPGEQGGSSQSGEHGGSSQSGEHGEGSESGEHGEGSDSEDGGEESGIQYTLDETYDVVRAGARLILSYDSGSNVFRGTVQNVTNSTLRRVRVEVHLSNGIELGPTTPIDLPPGETVDVTLKASEQSFETWSAHPEVG